MATAAENVGKKQWGEGRGQDMILEKRIEWADHPMRAPRAFPYK